MEKVDVARNSTLQSACSRSVPQPRSQGLADVRGAGLFGESPGDGRPGCSSLRNGVSVRGFAEDIGPIEEARPDEKFRELSKIRSPENLWSVVKHPAITEILLTGVRTVNSSARPAWQFRRSGRECRRTPAQPAQRVARLPNVPGMAWHGGWGLWGKGWADKCACQGSNRYGWGGGSSCRGFGLPGRGPSMRLCCGSG